MNESIEKTKKIFDKDSIDSIQKILKKKGFTCIVLNNEK
jgi:hypothetical protein